MTAYVFRPTRRKNGKLVKARLYSARYRLPSQAKIMTVPLHVTDREVAEQKLRELIRDIEKEEIGIRAPKRMRVAAQMLLVDHIAAFVADLRARKLDGEYVDTMERRLKKMANECEWRRLIDITGEGFQAWRSRQTTGAKTLNDYLATISQLCTWLQKSEVLAYNPLTKVAKAEERGNERRKRRALTPEELKAVIATAGRYRLAILTAYYTGLRRAELEQLEWADVQEAPNRTFIVPRSSTTKNRRAQRLYIPRWFAGELLAAKEQGTWSGARVFAAEDIPTIWRYKRLLKQAGISYKDEQGRQADFHALRRTANTHLANAGVDAQTRQEIMRHSDIRLTLDVYTDKGMLPIDGAVEKLPMFPRQGNDAHPCAHVPDFSGQGPARAGTEERLAKNTQLPQDESDRQATAHAGTYSQNAGSGCLARIRT